MYIGILTMLRSSSLRSESLYSPYGLADLLSTLSNFYKNKNNEQSKNYKIEIVNSCKSKQGKQRPDGAQNVAKSMDDNTSKSVLISSWLLSP